MNHEENLLAQLIDNDDITWQSMIFELVKTEQMDPWDVDIGNLAEKFISMVKEMHEINLRIGGKVILASTILLRLKSGRFIDSDLAQLESLIAGMNEEYDDYEFEEYNSQGGISIGRGERKRFKIFPRTPQPRKRSVSVYDLVSALEDVIEKQKIKAKYNRKDNRQTELKLESKDINIVIKDVFQKLNNQCKIQNQDRLKFSTLLPSQDKDDIIATFIPLLHLTNQRVTDLYQDNAFEDFDVHLLDTKLSLEDIEKITPD